MVNPKGGIVKRSSHSKYKKGELTLRYTTEEYVANLKKIIAVLKESSGTLIWANTTPVLRLSEMQEAGIVVRAQGGPLPQGALDDPAHPQLQILALGEKADQDEATGNDG